MKITFLLTEVLLYKLFHSVIDQIISCYITAHILHIILPLVISLNALCNSNIHFSFYWEDHIDDKSQGPQIEVPYPPTNGGQHHLGTLLAFVRPSVTFIINIMPIV